LQYNSGDDSWISSETIDEYWRRAVNRKSIARPLPSRSVGADRALDTFTSKEREFCSRSYRPLGSVVVLPAKRTPFVI
ncbi:MAG TPA: hypothetical protein VIA18_22695, partial [Polyangia bacterium]|nr:hypothetical protein [Polyangia bacterium]